MKILAVDTSCDDTSASVVIDGNVLSNVISSQIQFHKEWGGVVPSLAKRLHTEKIDTVIKKALKLAKINIEDIDAFAVTQGPGLAIALEVGINKLKELSKEYNKPLIPINHMEGHIYSTFAKNANGKGNIMDINFPYLALLVSGGHTELVLMKDHGVYEKIGETLDDAAGEAFDKAGRMLDIGYPGGKIISQFALEGNPDKYPLPIPLKNSKDYNFSYSGLKTAFHKVVEKAKTADEFNRQGIYDLSASFQKAAIEELIIKTKKAVKDFPVNGVLLAGGVSANIYLRKRLRDMLKSYNIPLYIPLNSKLCMDNAAMIGVCAYWKINSNNAVYADETLDRNPSLSL